MIEIWNGFEEMNDEYPPYKQQASNQLQRHATSTSKWISKHGDNNLAKRKQTQTRNTATTTMISSVDETTETKRRKKAVVSTMTSSHELDVKLVKSDSPLCEIMYEV